MSEHEQMTVNRLRDKIKEDVEKYNEELRKYQSQIDDLLSERAVLLEKIKSLEAVITPLENKLQETVRLNKQVLDLIEPFKNFAVIAGPQTIIGRGGVEITEADFAKLLSL